MSRVGVCGRIGGYRGEYGCGNYGGISARDSDSPCNSSRSDGWCCSGRCSYVGRGKLMDEFVVIIGEIIVLEWGLWGTCDNWGDSHITCGSSGG